ncbi:MAG: phosphate ABC transporter ATP-binding protein [Candidatus Hodarchaeota archaeon]
MTFVEFKTVSKKFPEKEVLKNISFEVEKGETFAIIGPNGSGKTTILRLLHMLDTPTSGKIILDGEDTNSSPQNQLRLRRRQSMVFQNPIMFRTTVYKNIAAGLKFRKEKPEEIDKKVKETLKYFDMLEFENQKATTLSGGEMQKVAIARVLVLKPELLLLDEPTANLDPASGALIEEMIKAIKQKKEHTIIMTTHNMFQAKRLADRVGFLYDGEIIESGPVKEIFENPKDKRVKAFISGEIIF